MDKHVKPVARGVTVLLVDDDPGVRRGISHYLKSCETLQPPLRVHCVEAASGKEALDVTAGLSVALAFVDYHMPFMDGLTCLDHLLGRDPDLPVTLLTGENSAVLAAEAIKRGACDYMVKSEATLEEIHRTLWKGLEWSAMRRRLRSQAGQLTEAENQRVMMESLAAVCHHLGQPATVLETCVALLRRERDPARIQTLLDDAQRAVDNLAELLKRMEGLRAYRTEPYLAQGTESADSIRLLVI